MRVVINGCFGGFGLSHEAVMALAGRKELTLYPEPDAIGVKHFGYPDDLNAYKSIIHYYKVPPEQYHALEEDVRTNDPDYKRLNEKDWYFSKRDISRDDSDLVAVVEELGERANGRHARLSVVEIPDGIDWTIEEYDGLEYVAEVHRVWH